MSSIIGTVLDFVKTLFIEDLPTVCTSISDGGFFVVKALTIIDRKYLLTYKSIRMKSN